MSSLIYHRVEVENSKSVYTEFDNLDFFLQTDGRALQKNSVRIEGDLRVLVNNGAGGTQRLTNENVLLDNVIGIHGLCDSFSVEFQNAGLVENYQEYSHYVKTKNIGELDRNDTHSSLKCCELITPKEDITQQMLGGDTSLNAQAVAGDRIDIDFSFKPIICINRMSDDVSFSKTGFIKVTLNLKKNASCFYGRDVDSSTAYELRNVRLTYRSVPDVNNSVQMRTVLSLKSSINTSFSNTMSKVPAVCDGVSCVFMKQSKEGALKLCNSDVEKLSGIKEVQFLFSDSTSQYVSYVIDDKGEMLDRFINSLSNSGHNMVNTNQNDMNFGIGLSFPAVDLSNQKFNIQINSDDNTISTDPYLIYQFFHSFVSM
tara:strand:+ start:1443 stop:2555 length:1113 start_codon:yes stop_codon:yes gene_type:complete